MVNRSFDEVGIGDTDLGDGRDPVDLDRRILGSDGRNHRPCSVTPLLALLVVVHGKVHEDDSRVGDGVSVGCHRSETARRAARSVDASARIAVDVAGEQCEPLMAAGHSEPQNVSPT